MGTGGSHTNGQLDNDDEQKRESGKGNDFEPEYHPRITFPNASEIEFSLKDGKKKFVFVEAGDEFDTDQVQYNFEIRATFNEYFELDSFPFDCQDLPIIMKLGGKGNSKNCRFLPDESRKIFAKMNLTTCVSTEFQFYPLVYEFGLTDAAASKRNKQFPLYINRIKIGRKYQFYIQRIALILMLLSIAELSSFSLGVDERADRLAVDFTLLLTVIAYQITINDCLPILPFFTVIDVYVISVVLFIVLIIIEHSLIGETQQDLDQICNYVFIGIWIIFHIAFGIYCPIIIRREKRKLLMNTQELEQVDEIEPHNGIIAYKAKADEIDIQHIENGGWASGIAQSVQKN